MQLSQEGLDLIKSFEGFKDHWYKCPAGIWTCCYGHTEAAGPPKYDPKRKFTKMQGESILKSDLKKYEDAVRRSIKVDLNDNQYSALVSLCYNIGPGAFQKSSVVKAVNAKQFDLVPARMALWNKGGGKVLKGLVRRRQAEADLFMSDVDDDEVFFSTEITPSQGKRPMASTTNVAATGAALAGATGVAREISANVSDTVQFFGIDVKYLLIAVGVAGVLAAVWIIKERITKSREEGV